LLYVVQFFGGRGVSLHRGLCWFIPGVAGRKFSVTGAAHQFSLSNVSQAGLELVVAASEATHEFSQCSVVWRSFLRARGPGYQSFDSHWYFIPGKCGSSVSARFWSHTAHAVCLHTLVAILDRP
jgi:hypothetical protein